MDEESFADSEEEYMSDESDVFQAPPVRAAESTYDVLDADACRSLAEAQVKEVCELLCCDARSAEVLLRHFRWDRDRLTDSERHMCFCMPTLHSKPCECSLICTLPCPGLCVETRAACAPRRCGC
jgi:hypothetical protein